MKHYLLLGQGDFIQHLMDLIAPELSKPAHHVFTEKLRIRGILETAIRGSNAQFDPLYVLENLDIQLLEPSPSEEGWDIFSLDYRFPPLDEGAPLSAIITPHVLDRYQAIFGFLWRLKRVEYSLSSAWRQHAKNRRAVGDWIPELGSVMHRIHILRNQVWWWW
jgi:gamma-tubulin complex component 3